MFTAQVMKKAKAFIETTSDFKYFLSVLSHVQKMVLYHRHPKLTSDQIEDINMAALLYGVDDRKFFPENGNCENARKILVEVFPTDWFRIEQVIYIIGLVSVSTNGNFIPVSDDDLWMLYPRFADRLESMGSVGVEKCLKEYSPLFLPSTPRCKTEEELWKIATPERFQDYLLSEESVSFIDHFYDKLLHIGKPEAFGVSDNDYLVGEAMTRHAYLVEYILNFGRTDKLN